MGLGDKIDFINDPQYKDRIQKAVIDASVLLKTFLRSMGEPLLTNRLYPELVKLADVNKSEKSVAIREFLRKLPAENYILLKTLIKFLNEVAANSQVNLMDANNLSNCFGSTTKKLFYPKIHRKNQMQIYVLREFKFDLKYSCRLNYCLKAFIFTFVLIVWFFSTHFTFFPSLNFNRGSCAGSLRLVENLTIKAVKT